MLVKVLFLKLKGLLLSFKKLTHYFSKFLKGLHLCLFRERGREGEREGEKHPCERETSIGCLWQVLRAAGVKPGPMEPSAEPGKERQWTLHRANGSFICSCGNYRGYIYNQIKFNSPPLDNEKLLWKGWWIMIINTAALLQLMQVCVLVTLMTFITFSYCIQQRDSLWVECAERKPCPRGFLWQQRFT